MNDFKAVANVYRVPPPSHRRSYAHDWDLKDPLFPCLVRVDPDAGSADEPLRVRLEDQNGDIIAVAPYDGMNGIAPVADSPRHYVLTISNGTLDAELGIGFANAEESVEFSLAIQKFMRRRMTEERLSSAKWSNRLVSKLDKSKDNEKGPPPVLEGPPQQLPQPTPSSSSEDEEFGEFH